MAAGAPGTGQGLEPRPCPELGAGMDPGWTRLRGQLQGAPSPAFSFSHAAAAGEPFLLFPTLLPSLLPSAHCRGTVPGHEALRAFTTSLPRP